MDEPEPSSLVEIEHWAWEHGDVIEFTPYGVAGRWMYIGSDRWVNRFGSVSVLPPHHSIWRNTPYRKVL